MIVVIDYNVGNLTSITNMLKRCGVDARISNQQEHILRASKFILPGVGSFDHGISNLRAAPYFDLLNSRVLEEKVPIMGVCLGAQLMASYSEEGGLPGLNWIPGSVIRFDDKRLNGALKIPHMGWAEIALKKKSSLFNNMPSEPRFYFVHSFHWQCDFQSDVLASAYHGYEFTAAVEHENMIGVQFHPEKSHKFGLKLYENFLTNY